MTARRVPLLDLAALHAPIQREIDAAIRAVVDSQQFILGEAVARLEKQLAAYCGAVYAIGCASGSDALYLALVALGIGAGDRVYVPAFTFFATAGAVTQAGAEPVFVDIDEATFNLDAAHLDKMIREKPDGKAVIAVHLYGGAADMDAIGAVAARHGLVVIEDGAQSIGGEYNDRRLLSIGRIGCLSFFPTKNLGCFGDGGMLTANDAELAERLRALRVHGSRERYRHDEVGVNSRLDALQAAVLLAKAPYLDEWTQARQRNAALYTGLLEDVAEVELPRAAAYQTRHVFNQYVIRCQRRDELKAHLAGQGVGSEIYYPIPLHLQPCYEGLGYREGQLPASEQACREVLALPVHSALTGADIEYVCGRLREFYGTV
ncbi:MAG: DegT/DnrJ/EryC1/StrS family aminotransferase [Acidimicrobiia bacterium]|nr:DegT/DnrJ/EryC1/StrS family aminotransferase [Acidimicrobiia bacterium]